MDGRFFGPGGPACGPDDSYLTQHAPFPQCEVAVTYCAPEWAMSPAGRHAVRAKNVLANDTHRIPTRDDDGSP